MDLAQQLLRQVLLVVGAEFLDALMDVDFLLGEGLDVVDGLAGGDDEVFSFVGDGGCRFGKAEVVVFEILVGLQEGHPLQIVRRVDGIFIKRGLVAVGLASRVGALDHVVASVE